MGWFDFTTGITAIAHPADADDITWTLDEVITSTTLTAEHFLVIVDASVGAIDITLPAATSHTDRIYTIKKIDSTSNKVTIDANSTETIDGEETVELKQQYSYITIICDGTEWFIIGGEYVKMEDTLEDLLEEQKNTVTELKRLYIEAKQGNLHLASLSGEDISEADIE